MRSATLRAKARDWWVDFCHPLPPFRGRLAAARIISETFLTRHENAVTWAKLPNGFKVKVDLRWRGGYDVLYYFREYERPLADLIRRAVDVEAGSFIDVGANIGVFCFWVADILRRRAGRALAIEPIPANYAFLTAGITENALRESVTPIAAAIADR